MSTLILTGSTNNVVFSVSQTDLSNLALVTDFSIYNSSGAPCFNPVDLPLVFLVIPEMSDYRTSLFLSTGTNRGHILATAYLRSPGIYSCSPGNNTIVTSNIFNRNITAILVDGAGLPLQLNVGTIYSVKINLR